MSFFVTFEKLKKFTIQSIKNEAKNWGRCFLFENSNNKQAFVKR